METRILSLVVVGDGKQVFDESASVVSIEDDAAGEYVKVHQLSDHCEQGVIKIDPDEWPALRKAINKMVRSCREYKS